MSDVFYLRPIVPAITPADVIEMSRHAGGCFGLHRVDWVRSFLSGDGGRMLLEPGSGRTVTIASGSASLASAACASEGRASLGSNAATSA